MTKKLEILIGDVKQVGEELAARTVQEIKEARSLGVLYTMACAKGTSALAYYHALREMDFDFGSVVALCIDEDLGKLESAAFIRKNLSCLYRVEAPVTRFNVEGDRVILEDERPFVRELSVTHDASQLVDSAKFASIKQENPHWFYPHGREITIMCHDDEETHRGWAQFDISYAISDAVNRYNGLISNIHLAIIGLGVNPLHIGSNFPPTSPESRTHLGEKVDKDGKVIGYAMTMGIATLCSARQAILFASGDAKAEGIKQVLEGPITEDCPPSYLRGMNHLVVALDQVAASKLDLSKLKGMYQDRELLITNL